MNEGTHHPTATAEELSPAQRHIIERPRLTKLLDEADARVILLVAPAGYGKTTLAREWMSQGGRTALRYRTRGRTPDIGAVARGLAQAISPISPRAERTVREFLAVHPEPPPDVLAELLAGDLKGWPSGTWLVLDEYESLRSNEGLEAFVEVFLNASKALTLITSRVPPEWLRPRDLLYGDVLEIRQSALAMTLDEVAQALTHADHESSAVVALADGWPAVIGLASRLSGAVQPESDMQHALFDYLAQELFEGLDPLVQHYLVLLSMPTTLDLQLIQAVVGSEAQRVIEGSVRAGLMNVRADEVEIHPLCRSFLERKVWDVDIARTEIEKLADHLTEACQWDDAFEVVRRFGLVDRFPALLATGGRRALREGRVATIEKWINWAEDNGLETPEMALSRAEMYLCRGDSLLSESLALACVRSAPSANFAARAHLCAGMAAHLLDEVDQARLHYSNAASCDDAPEVRRRALWGQFLSSQLTNRADYYIPALAALEAEDDPSPEHQLRLQQAKIVLGGREGNLTTLIDQGLAGVPLLEHVEDPYIRSGFLHHLAYALTLTARYAEAEHLARRELTEGQRFHLDFVEPNALMNLAAAKIGLGSYTAAAALIDRSERQTPMTDDFLRVKRAIMRADIDLARLRSDKAAAAPSRLTC